MMQINDKNYSIIQAEMEKAISARGSFDPNQLCEQLFSYSKIWHYLGTSTPDLNLQLREFITLSQDSLLQDLGRHRYQLIKEKAPPFPINGQEAFAFYQFIRAIREKDVAWQAVKSTLEEKYSPSPRLSEALNYAWVKASDAEEELIEILARGKFKKLNKQEQQKRQQLRAIADKRILLSKSRQRKIAAQKIKAADARKRDWNDKIALCVFPHLKLFLHSPIAKAYTDGEISLQDAFEELQLRAEYLGLLEQIKAYPLAPQTERLLQGHRTFLFCCPTKLNEQDIDAYHHIRKVFEEIKQGEYSNTTVSAVLHCLMQMTYPGVDSQALDDYLSLKQLTKEEYFLYPPREITGAFIKDKHGERQAKLRTGNNSEGSKEYEQLAYEVDHILGGSNVPPAIRLGNKSILQRYVRDSETLEEILQHHSNQTQHLKNLDATTVQLFVTYALIRGRGDAHWNNTVFSQSGQLFDIDEEDNFMKRNIMGPSNYIAEEGYNFCMAAMGLPQNQQPYSPLVLKLFGWKGIKNKILRQINLRQIQANSEALNQRLERLFEAFHYESLKESPTLTPRELFFLMHGKDYAVFRLKEAQYRDMEIWGGAYANI